MHAYLIQFYFIVLDVRDGTDLNITQLFFLVYIQVIFTERAPMLYHLAVLPYRLQT